MCCKKHVYSPEKLSSENKENIVILIGSMYFNKISLQLENLGFIKGREFFSIEENEKASIHKTINGVNVGKYSYGYENYCLKGIVESVGSFSSINHTSVIP